MTELAKPFKKLVEKPATSLLRLPAWVRGYAAEMLRVASRPTGRVCDTALVDDVAFAIRAHAGEEEDLAEAIRLLLDEGSLLEKDGALYIANFSEEQKNYEAARKQAQRDQQRSQSRVVPDVPDSPVSSGSSGIVPQEEIRSEEIRSEEIREGGAASVVFAHWASHLWIRVHKSGKPKQTAGRMKPIRARLKDGLTVEQLSLAIDAAAATPFYLGENDRGTAYIEPETIFRSVGKVEELLSKRAPAPTVARIGLVKNGMRQPDSGYRPHLAATEVK